MGGPPATGRSRSGSGADLAVRVAALSGGHGAEAAGCHGAHLSSRTTARPAPAGARARAAPRRRKRCNWGGSGSAAGKTSGRSNAGETPRSAITSRVAGPGRCVVGRCPHLHVVPTPVGFPWNHVAGAPDGGPVPGPATGSLRAMVPVREPEGRTSCDPASDVRRLHRPYPIRAAVGGGAGRGPGADRRGAGGAGGRPPAGAGRRRGPRRARRSRPPPPGGAPAPPGPCPRGGDRGARRRGGGAAASRGGAPPIRPRRVRPRSPRARSRPARGRARTAVDGRPCDHDA